MSDNEDRVVPSKDEAIRTNINNREYTVYRITDTLMTIEEAIAYMKSCGYTTVEASQYLLLLRREEAKERWNILMKKMA